MSRGNDRRSVFEDERECQRLLEELEQTVGRFGCGVLRLALLPINFHLSLRAPQPTTEWAIHSLFDFLGPWDRVREAGRVRYC